MLKSPEFTKNHCHLSIDDCQVHDHRCRIELKRNWWRFHAHTRGFFLSILSSKCKKLWIVYSNKLSLGNNFVQNIPSPKDLKQDFEWIHIRYVQSDPCVYIPYIIGLFSSRIFFAVFVSNASALFSLSLKFTFLNQYVYSSNSSQIYL